MRSRVDHTFFAGAPVLLTMVSKACHLPSLNCALMSFPRSRRDVCLRFRVSAVACDFEEGLCAGCCSVDWDMARKRPIIIMGLDPTVWSWWKTERRAPLRIESAFP